LGRWGLDEIGLGRWGLGKIGLGRWVCGSARWVTEMVGEAEMRNKEEDNAERGEMQSTNKAERGETKQRGEMEKKKVKRKNIFFY